MGHKIVGWCAQTKLNSHGLRLLASLPCQSGGSVWLDSHWREEMGLLFHTRGEKCTEAAGSESRWPSSESEVRKIGWQSLPGGVLGKPRHTVGRICPKRFHDNEEDLLGHSSAPLRGNHEHYSRLLIDYFYKNGLISFKEIINYLIII